MINTVTGRTIQLLTSPAGNLVLDDNSSEGPAAVVGYSQFVYDLGMLVLIDKVLFGTEFDILHKNTSGIDQEPSKITEAPSEDEIEDTTVIFRIKLKEESNNSNATDKKDFDKNQKDNKTKKITKLESDKSVKDTDTKNNTPTSASGVQSNGVESFTSQDQSFFTENPISEHLFNSTGFDDVIIFPETEMNELLDLETTTLHTMTTQDVNDDAEEINEDKSLIVFKVKELLAEEQLSNNLLQSSEIIKPRETRIVYINNQRVEIEDSEVL